MLRRSIACVIVLCAVGRLVAAVELTGSPAPPVPESLLGKPPAEQTPNPESREPAPARVEPIVARPPESSPTPLLPGRWALESMKLVGGRTFRGLIEARDHGQVRFVQVVRPPSRPAYLISLKVPAKSVSRLDRLPTKEHELLAQRVADFREQRGSEAERMERLTLRPARRDGWPVLRYTGPWFTLDSSTDDETTRRSIVRMEQVFGAYESQLPPRVEPRRSLEIVIWGSPEQYHLFLARRGADMANPAFFSPADNVVVAGLDLDHWSHERDSVRALRRVARQRLDRREAEFRDLARQQQEKPELAGVSGDLLKKIYGARADAIRLEKERILRELADYDRQASTAFDEATRKSFAMLAHEAFHAYLENYVYPAGQYKVPRWLNEGLAQIFEHGQLEGETLRIDGAPPMLLAQLRSELQSDHALRLADLLKSEQDQFLVTRPGAQDESRRHYLFSWGLAHYLTLDLDLLGSRAMDRYVAPQPRAGSEQQQFERFVASPLEKFEVQWRQAMLGQGEELRQGEKDRPVPAAAERPAPSALGAGL